MIIFSKIGLDFRYFQAFIIFVITYIFLYFIVKISYKDNFKKNIDKRLLAIFLLFYPIMMFFTQYHNLLSYIFSFVALYFLFHNRKILGFSIFFIAILIHPAAYIPFFVYIVSNISKVKINKKLLIILVFISLIASLFINQIPFETIIPNKLLAHKIQFYLTSEWTKYKWKDPGEWLYVYKLAILIVLVFFIGLNLEKYEIKDNFFINYNKFILWYIVLAIIVISYRSIAMRVISTGLIFFIPLLYQFLMAQRKNIFLLILTFFLFDPRFFLSLGYSNIYKVGRGLPYSIFDNTYQILSRKEFIYEYRN
jgi:hypothetical protein